MHNSRYHQLVAFLLLFAQSCSMQEVILESIHDDGLLRSRISSADDIVIAKVLGEERLCGKEHRIRIGSDQEFSVTAATFKVKIIHLIKGSLHVGSEFSLFYNQVSGRYAYSTTRSFERIHSDATYIFYCKRHLGKVRLIGDVYSTSYLLANPATPGPVIGERASIQVARIMINDLWLRPSSNIGASVLALENQLCQLGDEAVINSMIESSARQVMNENAGELPFVPRISCR